MLDTQTQTMNEGSLDGSGIALQGLEHIAANDERRTFRIGGTPLDLLNHTFTLL